MDIEKQGNLPETVPYVVFESTQARAERRHRLLCWLLGFAVALIFLSNAAWLFAWFQYDYADVTVDGKDGVASYIGNDGDIYNGEDFCKASDEEKRQGEKD